MKITIQEDEHNEQIEVLIKCKKCDEEILSLITRIKAEDEKIVGISDGKNHILNPKVIYYFESVDKKTFIYTKDAVYETVLRLYELERMLRSKGFLRATKASIINISKIKELRPAFNSIIMVELENGEKLTVSRQYAKNLKEKLNII